MIHWHVLMLYRERDAKALLLFGGVEHCRKMLKIEDESQSANASDAANFNRTADDLQMVTGPV